MSSNARKIISLYSIAEAQQINIDSEEYQKKNGRGRKTNQTQIEYKTYAFNLYTRWAQARNNVPFGFIQSHRVESIP